MSRDADLEPQLGGEWTVELVANDNLESMWVVCTMQRADDSEQQQQERQHSEQARHSPEGVHVTQELRHDQLLEASPVQQRLPPPTAQHQLQGTGQHAAHPLQQVLPKAIDAQQASQPLGRSRDSDDQPAPQQFDMHGQRPEQRSREREGQPRQRSNGSQPRRRSNESGGEPAAGGLDRGSQRGHSREREDQPQQRGWDGDRQPRRRSDDSGGHTRGWDRDRQHPEQCSREREREDQPRQRGWDRDSQPRRRSNGSGGPLSDWDRDGDRQHPERSREREVQPRQRRPDSDGAQDDLQLEGPGDRRSLSDHEQQRLQRNSQDGCSRGYGQQRGCDHQQQRGGDAHVQQQQRGAKRDREGAHGHDSTHRHYSDDRGWLGQEHSWEHDRDRKRSHSDSAGRSSR